VCTVVGLAANLPVLCSYYGTSFWGVDLALTRAVRKQGVHRAIVFVRDYNRARAVALRLRGVSWRVTQSALDALDDRWIDRQIREADAAPGGAPARAAMLEQRLWAAVVDPARPHRRRTAPWIDHQGYSSNVYLGSWENTPWLERQDVIYALDLGDRNHLLLQDYPGRAAWLYDFDREEWRFRLRPWSPG